MAISRTDLEQLNKDQLVNFILVFLDPIDDIDTKLSLTQRSIASLLLRKNGGVVTRRMIELYLGREMSPPNIRVQIYNLRNRLPPNMTIVTHHRQGWSLHTA